MNAVIKKSKLRRIFCLTSSFFFLGFAAVNIYSIKIEKILKNFSKINVQFYNTGCIVKTFGKSSGTVSAALAFFKPSGEHINSYERSWPGKELTIECLVIISGESSILFPLRIFSNSSKRGTGVDVLNYYNKNGYPALYDYAFLSQKEKNIIKTLYYYAYLSPCLLQTFAHAKIKSVTLSDFTPGAEYSLLLHNKEELILVHN